MERIKLWWKFEGKYYLKNLKNGISNLIYYFPVIWRDRNWDHQYMEDLILHKYKKWYNIYSKEVELEYVGKDKHVQAMRILINILERRKNGWYINVWHSKYAYKEEMVFIPIPNSKYFELKMVGLTEEEKMLSNQWHNKVEKCEERDWKLYNQITEKYFRNFWD